VWKFRKTTLSNVKRAKNIQNLQRSGLKIPDKAKIFIKKNHRKHSYHQFWQRSSSTESILTKVYCSLFADDINYHMSNPLHVLKRTVNLKNIDRQLVVFADVHES